MSKQVIGKLTALKQLKAAYLQQMFPQDGESVPRVRFGGFSGDWEQRKLSEIGSTYAGLSGKTKEDFGKGDARFITYMNVFANPLASLEELGEVEIDDKQNTVNYGDVLFTTSSETPEEVGMSSVWLHSMENVYLNSFCFGFRPEIKIDPYYSAFMLRSPAVRTKIQFLAQGISRYNISKTKMLEIEVSVPSIPEQTAIGSFFRTLDELIALHQRKLDALKNLKKTYLQRMFVATKYSEKTLQNTEISIVTGANREPQNVPELRFDGFAEPWTQRKLGEVVFSLRSGLSRMLSNEDIGLPVVRANNIVDGKFDMENDVKYWYIDDPQGAQTSNFLVCKDDILINFINSESRMGTATIVTENPSRNTIYTTNILNLRTNEYASPYFIFTMTFSKKYQDYISSITKPAVSQASFTTVDFKNYIFGCPSVAEQTVIGSFFRNLDELIKLYS